ncbi:Protein PHR1-LIKE 3 [Cardamine amara subsp. amara]|uniref:Protein PHR1-LIKE 3 n=1 Tax=Cardamine amara subsp. amara TaxID=228776 RepID=A0ABD1B271_CARAN
MSSQEMKKKEKGKEVVTSFHHPDHFDHTEEVPMFFSEQEISALLEATKETCKENLGLEQSKRDCSEKVGIEEGKSSSSKITPCIFYTSDEKARLRWSSDLHDCFVNAVAKLGGPNKATPKSVKEMMEVEGIALHHVKSHLQKFRLGKCNIRDGTKQYIRRYKNAREITKSSASVIPPRPLVNIKPKVMESIKPKHKKAKEVHGSLYMLIKHDLHLQRSREAQRMQMTLAIENQRKMLEAQYFKASITPSVPSQYTNYTLPATIISQQPSSLKQEQWPPLSYATSIEDFCNDNMACLSLSDFTQNTRNTLSIYKPLMHPTQGSLQFNDNHNYNMGQGFIYPYMNINRQSMAGSSTFTTHQQIHLNGDGVIYNSCCNTTFLPSVVPGVIDSDLYHQGTSNNAISFSATPQSLQGNVPYHMYSSYPPYNTLEVVKAQLDALQSSSTSQTQEIPSHETNLSSFATVDEVDPVDKYIDWGKVEETNTELDPVEILEALGLGVNP